MQALQNSIAEH
jgi:hypothetical protein